MTHYMNLMPLPFSKIADGSKTIELRLNDEKRQKIAVGDTIVFTHTETQETLSAKVLALHKFPEILKPFTKPYRLKNADMPKASFPQPTIPIWKRITPKKKSKNTARLG